MTHIGFAIAELEIEQTKKFNFSCIDLDYSKSTRIDNDLLTPIIKCEGSANKYVQKNGVIIEYRNYTDLSKVNRNLYIESRVDFIGIQDFGLFIDDFKESLNIAVCKILEELIVNEPDLKEFDYSITFSEKKEGKAKFTINPSNPILEWGVLVINNIPINYVYRRDGIHFCIKFFLEMRWSKRS